ncbi:hypothetical protein R1flu_018702 [Riccia fluitans]|uniref:Cullin N-terminal domain-containing protein n=1 Tax=Riccia fluitans TaxID=41844 RepID=A0ABD1ZK34_9MARC
MIVTSDLQDMRGRLMRIWRKIPRLCKLLVELHSASCGRAHVIPDLECSSVYYWEVRKGYVIDEKHCKFSLLLWCCSRADRVQFRKDKEQQDPAKRQQEKRRCINRYECYGEAKVVVDLIGRTMELFIQHFCRHENLAYRQNNVPQAAIDFLETHVNSQLRRVDLYNMLCKEGLIDPTFICKA